MAVAAGDRHMVITTADGLLFSFGCGANGRLGHGEDRDELTPRLVERLMWKKIKAVACGQNHTVLCTAEGEVFACGYGGDGQLGHDAHGVEDLEGFELTVPCPVQASP